VLNAHSMTLQPGKWCPTQTTAPTGTSSDQLRQQIGKYRAMETVQVQQVVTKDGEVLITGLPYKKGRRVEVIVFPHVTTSSSRAHLTVGRLRHSGLIGLWQDRDDIGDSSAHARQLREQVQRRVRSR
jgi:hypothetical protein